MGSNQLNAAQKLVVSYMPVTCGGFFFKPQNLKAAAYQES